MQKLNTEKRAQILRCLIEGTSVLATSRITGAAKGTILALLEQAGEACQVYQDRNLRKLSCKVVQLDEIWSFVGCRDSNKDEAKNEHPGDVWTWTALDAETKLIPAWRVGDRSSRTAYAFCLDLSKRLTGEVQITSDGHTAYRMAVGSNFDLDKTHFAQLVKIYGLDKDGKQIVTRADKVPVYGQPDMELVSTSYVERSNLTIRMSNRRFTRMTNAFSKKLENHCHMLAVSFFQYNFVRRHSTIKTTPAVAAGIADHQWTMEEMVEMIDRYFEEKLHAEYERAFAVKCTAPRTKPRTYTPTPKDQIPLPWYLDPNGEPPLESL